MKTVIQKSSLGIVLDSMALGGPNAPAPLRAHLVLNHRLLDDDGYCRVTDTAGFLEILDIIDSLKAELDSLANDTILWFAQTIASRRMRFAVVSNASRERGGGIDGEDNRTIVPPSLAHRRLAPASPWSDRKPLDLS